MARRKYVYLIERVKDSIDWPKGIQIWSTRPCPGWKIVHKMEVR